MTLMMRCLVKRLNLLHAELEHLDKEIKTLEYQWNLTWPESRINL